MHARDRRDVPDLRVVARRLRRLDPRADRARAARPRPAAAGPVVRRVPAAVRVALSRLGCRARRGHARQRVHDHGVPRGGLAHVVRAAGGALHRALPRPQCRLGHGVRAARAQRRVPLHAAGRGVAVAGGAACRARRPARGVYRDCERRRPRRGPPALVRRADLVRQQVREFDTAVTRARRLCGVAGFVVARARARGARPPRAAPVHAPDRGDRRAAPRAAAVRRVDDRALVRAGRSPGARSGRRGVPAGRARRGRRGRPGLYFAGILGHSAGHLAPPIDLSLPKLVGLVLSIAPALVFAGIAAPALARAGSAARVSCGFVRRWRSRSSCGCRGRGRSSPSTRARTWRGSRSR